VAGRGYRWDMTDPHPPDDRETPAPSTNRPLNAERRPVVKPVLLLVLFVVVLVGLYLIGTEVLVSAE
jgi:hypothetical protein